MSSWQGPYALILYTDKYAGNFDRELCAASTGQIGECEVGKELASKYDGPDLSDIIDMVMDEDDTCSRPCSIWHDETMVNDDNHNYTAVAIYFVEVPTDKQILGILNRAKAFGRDGKIHHQSPNINIERYRLIHRRITVETKTIKEGKIYA